MPTAKARRRLVFLLAPLLVALALLVPSGTARGSEQARPEGLARFQGSYTFAGGDREREALHGAIDQVADQLNVFVREIARGRIRDAIQPETGVGVAVLDGDRVRVRLGEWESPAARADGSVQDVRGPDGADTRFSVRFANDRIATRATTSRGTRESWLSLDEGGRYLFLQVRVSASQLPDSIRYTLTYRRVE